MKKTGHIIKIIAVLLSISACSKPQTCNQDNECSAGYLCQDKQCQKAMTCADLSNKCTAEQECKIVNRSAQCITRNCFAKTDCPSDLICANGSCIDSQSIFSEIKKCEITNSIRQAPKSAELALSFVAYDKDNRILSIPKDILKKENITLTPKDREQTAESIFLLNEKNNLVAQDVAGKIQVKIKLNQIECSQVFANTGSLKNNQIRVTLYDTEQPEKDIVIDSNDIFLRDTSGKTIANIETAATVFSNVFTLNNVPSVSDKKIESITVATKGYKPTAVLGVHLLDEYDFLIPLEPQVGSATGYSANFDFSAYDSIFAEQKKNALALAFSGASISLSSLLNQGQSLLFGDAGAQEINTQKFFQAEPNGTVCNVAQNTTAQTESEVSLPRVLFAALGKQEDVSTRTPIGANCEAVSVRAGAGARMAWTVASKVDPTDLKFLTLLGNSDSIKWEELIAKALDWVDSLAISIDSLNKKLGFEQESTWLSYIKEKFTGQNQSSFAKHTHKPELKLNHVAQIQNPGKNDDPYSDYTRKLNTFISIVGAYSQPHGFIPLGFGFAYDKDNDGILDILKRDDPRLISDRIYTRYASPSKDIAHFDLVSLVANFSRDGDATKRLKVLVNQANNGQKPWTDVDSKTQKIANFDKTAAAFTYSKYEQVVFQNTDTGDVKFSLPELRIEDKSVAAIPDLLYAQIRYNNGPRNEIGNMNVYIPKKAISYYQLKKIMVGTDNNQQLKDFITAFSNPDAAMSVVFYGFNFSDPSILGASRLNAALPLDINQHAQALKSLSRMELDLQR